MIRLIAVAGFALAVATSAQAMAPAPVHQPEGVITQVAFGCGPFRNELKVSAWPEPPSATSAGKSAGVHNGTEAFALGTTERPTLRLTRLIGHRFSAEAIIKTTVSMVRQRATHRRQFGFAIAHRHHVNAIGRRDVVVRLQVRGCLRQPVERDQFVPCISLGETAAHFVRFAPACGASCAVSPCGRRRPGRGCITHHPRSPRSLRTGTRRLSMAALA